MIHADIIDDEILGQHRILLGGAALLVMIAQRRIDEHEVGLVKAPFHILGDGDGQLYIPVKTPAQFILFPLQTIGMKIVGKLTLRQLIRADFLLILL